MLNAFLAKRKRKNFCNTQYDFINQFFFSTPIDFSTPVIESNILSVDLETSGLDEKQDQILSVASLDVSKGAALAHTLKYDVVKQDFAYTDATLVHGLTQQDMEFGKSLEEVIQDFIVSATGKVILAHNVTSDWGFLNQAVKDLYGVDLVIPVVDTLRLERRRLERKEAVLSPNTLTLAACRSRYGLPDFAEHDPRNDALATAELLMSHMQTITAMEKITLSDIGAKWYF